MVLVDAPLDDIGVVYRLGGTRPSGVALREHYDGVAASVRLACTCGGHALVAATPPVDAEWLEVAFWRLHSGAGHQPCDENTARAERIRRLIEEAA